MRDEHHLQSALTAGRYANWHVDPPQEREEENWLLVYLDVMTLLLVMLVVLLSFSNRMPGVSLPEPFDDPVLAEAHVLDGKPGLLDGLPVDAAPEVQAAGDAGDSGGGVSQGSSGFDSLLADGLGDEVGVFLTEGSVNLRISNEILFASGQAELMPAGAALIDRLGALLREGYYRIAVEGHTDDVPIATARFPSNWELSGARASSVVRRLESVGVERVRLRATGFADTRPLDDHRTPEGRAMNRRVELVLETPP